MSSETPVAIVGIGCKFPGGSETKELYYEFLRNKGDGMVQPPADRWNHAEWNGGKDEPGKYCAAAGGFVSGIDLFDPLEFGISMKEAQHLDPSLRLSLEVAHQALQDSGIDYRGSNTGVYFAQLLTSHFELDDDRYEISGYNGLGKCIAIRANRISFTFDLRGPSLTLDTACSSSGTAMHIALSAIKIGDIDQALVVGASTMVNPEHTVSFSKLGVLSPTGSSKSFDASADGYARAEGFGAVLIKRLDHAIRDGDNIYSVITGSSINANGKGKSLTMPEGEMQAETIKQAYRNAGRAPSDAFYVELHATGTAVGDPIEANAAGRVFARGREADRVLRVGSVKANIGHAEGCSFLASMIKVSLMLHKKELIPNIRFNKPNPKIRFEKNLMKVQTELEPMTVDMAADDGKWVTSISSYGVGGANAHVVIETYESAQDALNETTTTTAPSASHEQLYLFPIGALTEPALARWKESLAAHFDGVTDDRTLRSISKELTRQTRSYPCRAFSISATLSPSSKFSKPSIISGNADPKLCLVFAGQGPQHILMGRQLAEAYPAFLKAIMENDGVLVGKYGQESFLESSGLFVPGRKSTLAGNGVWPVKDVVYSLVFIQVALVDLIKSLGLKYDFVVGHSIGEIAMGYASGHYDRETAIGIAVGRAAAMTKADGNGCMVALGVGVQKAEKMVKKVLAAAGASSGLWIAGINSPQAVTVAGKENLIDAMVELAADPAAKVFAAKLRVTCAFHTPLMEPQEAIFKTYVKAALERGSTSTPTARVMSTVDGKWLERDLDIDYCWDNIRKPVLFGTAIDKIVKQNGADNVVFLEIAPHPVLKSYIEQCGGEPVTLIRRPNPKAPAQNTGEHYQFLEGVGHLLSKGFKRVALEKLCAGPEGVEDYSKVSLPEYPYNRSSCWSESGSERSMRLREKARPLAPSSFRVSVDTHPDLTGHIVFDAVLFPASGYIDSILQNGAMVARDVHIHKPLVLNAHGTDPAYAGCVIRGNKWEFRASTNNEFDNGTVILDSCYASGSFSKENPAFNPKSLRYFDIKSKLALSQGSITGDEFHAAIPAAYRYQDHFKNYLVTVHEVADEQSWGGKAYLTRLEVPEGTPDIFGNGYCIHPGILDSITQCGLAMFINMETKQFDFGGVFLPVKIDSITRWDSKDSPNLDDELKGGIWTYFSGRTWAPGGPFKSDYTITNSEGRVLFTIEGFEIARAPEAEPVVITDETVDERLTTVWQPKHFPSHGFELPPIPSITLSASQRTDLYIQEVFEGLALGAQAKGRRVVRVLDSDYSTSVTRALDASLVALCTEAHLVVEYFCGAATAAEADAKTAAMQYSHARSAIVESEYAPADRFDLVVARMDLSSPPAVVPSLKQIVPSGVLVILVDHENGAVDVLRSDVLEHLRTSAAEANVVNISAQSSLVLIRSQDCVLGDNVGTPASPNVQIHHFARGNEGDLVRIVDALSADSELWIVGNDDAAGIGALGLAACLLAESPEYIVRSALFEDHQLPEVEREKIIGSLRQAPALLEQHLKISTDRHVLVRRLVCGPTEVKDIHAPGFGPRSSQGHLSAYFPPIAGENEVEVYVDFLGTIEAAGPNEHLVTFVGSVGESFTKVVGIASQPLVNIVLAKQKSLVHVPDGIAETDIAALPSATLVAWMALVESSKISSESIVLLHDAGSHVGSGAIQICQRFGARYFCTVATNEDAERLSTELGVDHKDITVISAGEDVTGFVSQWLSERNSDGFDVVFNSEGSSDFSGGAENLTALGRYVHHQKCSERLVLPVGAPNTQVINLSKLSKAYPALITRTLSGLLAAHASRPFLLSNHAVSLSDLRNHNPALFSNTLIAVPDNQPEVRIDTSGQIFDPRKSYVLVGGSSELGVRIAEWMAAHGARHIILTSRRGPKALTKVDNMYLHYLRLSGVSVHVSAVDAVNRQAMASMLDHAHAIAPVGGVFLMTVVLRDGKFSNLTQDSFDDVYASKVDALNTLLQCIKIEDLDFLLLFSTIGSVFGNAGQAAYCSSQLYLDRIADMLPNTISMSIPPIIDSGIFKRLVLASKGRANTSQLTKTGMTTAQVCNFIGDSLIRRITHYVPMLSIKDVPSTFPTCEPLLYRHLLPMQMLNSEASHSKDGNMSESPASLLSALVGLNPDQITENALITSFGLDSLAATRYSNQLKSNFGIKVSQIELLGSMTVGILNEMISKLGASSGGLTAGVSVDDGSSKYGIPLTGILDERLAYGESYTTDASPHQYRIWLAQAEYDNARKRTASKIDPAMSRFGATHWDTHEAYFITVTTKSQLDVNRMADAFAEVIQRHGALRTAFSWNEVEGKLEQTIFPSVDFKAKLVDLSGQPNAASKAYEMSLAENEEPNFKLDQLPLLTATMFDLGRGEWGFNIVIHHIIIDEASIGIFFYELFSLYLDGPESLPPVSLHYSDFSDWLLCTSERRAELRDEQLTFWADNLKDVHPLHLTLAKASEKELSPVTQIETSLDVETMKQYNQLMAGAGVTPFAGFFAAYNILLYKYSAQSSFVVGTAVTQRSAAPLADVIGFFANMLPIKTNIDDEELFSEYLATFKEGLMKCLANDDVTYEDIVAQARNSSQSRSYFKHLFAYGGLNLDTVAQLERNDLQATALHPLPNGREKYEFLLTVHAGTGKLVLRFDNHLYSEKVARQFLDAYANLIGQLAEDPHAKISDISAVTVGEEKYLLNNLSSSSSATIIERCLHHLVEDQVQSSPSLTAVEFEDQSLTYAELNSRANRIAHSLIHQGVGPGSVVALCFDRGIHQIIGILAVLKAGGAFLPLDPEDPTLRKELMIADCAAKVLLTTSNHSRVFEKSLSSKILIAYIDDPSFIKRLARYDDQNILVPGISPSNLAYIMFTSGSTGKPKGVMIEHRSISNLVQHSEVYGFRHGARVMSSLAYTFDPFVVDVFGTLSKGATLVTGRKELVLGDIQKAVNSLSINVLHLTPSILAVVPVQAFPTLDTIVVAGEPLGKKTIEDWSKRFKLMNMYGPTEASVDCISCHVTSSSMTGIIGRPLANNRVYILDKQMRPTPIGVEGELYIGGIQLARGYLNKPELTAASFIPNPFVQGERLYSTGDIALYRADDNIEYCGRRDRQIKLRGQRIELPEIEDALVQYHAVQRAAVVIRTIQDAPALVAFVELRPGFTAHVEDEKEALKLHVAERLPRFMYPSLFAIVPTLPESRSGKIDRKALLQLDLTPFAPETSQDLATPQSEVERELLNIFSAILRVDPGTFGVTNDLFSVGMNSLMAVQAAGTISKTFNVHIGLNNMYLRPTIRELASLVIDAIGQESRQLMEAEDTDADYLIEFLPIKRKGAQPRLFIVHDITGMATPFMRLGAFMSNEMYAIGDLHFGSATGFGSIEAMADHYISLIKSVQPQGPYLISGYSFGGTVALCMASKMKKAGDDVQHLILFDSIFIPSAERQSLKSTDWTQRSIDRIAENFPEIGDKWKNKLRTEIRKNLDTMFDHEPEHYDGPTTLVVPKDRSWYRNGHASDFDTGVDDRNGWDYRLSNLGMKVAAGRHDTMFAPAHVKSVAAVLKEIFEGLPLDTTSQPTPAPEVSKSAKARNLLRRRLSKSTLNA